VIDALYEIVVLRCVTAGFAFVLAVVTVLATGLTSSRWRRSSP